MHLIDLKLLTLAGAYMAFLFAVAWLSERSRRTRRPHSRAFVYGLSLAVYCTSWTYFGAVGTAARSGWDYLPIYIGPSLVLTLLFLLWRRIAVAAKRENAGSIADFLVARYGKRPLVGMVVAAVAILGALPYIALQPRSITMAVKLLGGSATATATGAVTTFAFAAVLAGFAMLFGARRVGLTEHNPGFVRAIAVESVVKLTALISAGVFAVLVLRAMPDGLHLVAPLSQPKLPSVAFLTQFLLSAAVFICLPRQFYMGFVELEDPRDMGWARWMLPLYLLLTCLAVVPIATAGLRLAKRSRSSSQLADGATGDQVMPAMRWVMASTMASSGADLGTKPAAPRRSAMVMRSAVSSAETMVIGTPSCVARNSIRPANPLVSGRLISSKIRSGRPCWVNALRASPRLPVSITLQSGQAPAMASVSAVRNKG